VTVNAVDANWNPITTATDTVGITSGASVPEIVVEGVVRRIREWHPESAIESFGDVETLVFRLPPGLARVGA